MKLKRVKDGKIVDNCSIIEVKDRNLGYVKKVVYFEDGMWKSEFIEKPFTGNPMYVPVEKTATSSETKGHTRQSHKRSSFNYYRRNKAADTIVRTLFSEKFLGSNGFKQDIDFSDFIEELERRGIHLQSEHFKEIMFEVVNRNVLMESFSKWLKERLF